MQNSTEEKTDFVVPILLNTFFLCGFIFLRIFYNNFNFLASTLKLSLYSFLPALLIILCIKNFLLKLHDHPKHRKSIQWMMVILTGINFWMFLTGVSGYLNQKLDQSEAKTLILGIEAIEQYSTKRGMVRVAVISLPFETGGFGIPDAKVEIPVTKEEEKIFNLGTSKIQFSYKEGYLKVPWLIERKFIP